VEEKMAKSRTTINFQWQGDLWTRVDHWAREQNYKLKTEGETERMYQKGRGFLVAPMMLQINYNGKDVRMEAWARANLFVRAMALFIIPSEMDIGSGGVRMALPRKIARKAVNQLLTELGQAEIQ
jgi:hypothetical protein